MAPDSVESNPSEPQVGPRTFRRRDIFRKKESLVAREIVGETLIVPIRGELAQLHKLFSLNPVAAFIWKQIDGINDLTKIHRLLVERFEAPDEEIWNDLLELIEHLAYSQLIEMLEKTA